MQIWKLLSITAIASLFFSGCSSQTNVLSYKQKYFQQVQVIQQQQAQINLLKKRLKNKQLKNIQTKNKRSKNKVKSVEIKRKNIKLKKVEDHNFSSDYMYPQTNTPPKKAVTVAQVASTSPSVAMTKAECISMIGQEKFDKYTKMFGNEAASIKRCKMLKAMKN